MTSSDREIGELSARVSHLENQLTSMSDDLRMVRDTLMQAKGGWKTVMLVAGFSSVIGAALMKIVPFLSFFPK